MKPTFKEVQLQKFVLDYQSQTEAAKAIGITQSGLSQALADIASGKRQVIVKVFKDGRLEAETRKPLGKSAA